MTNRKLSKQIRKMAISHYNKMMSEARNVAKDYKVERVPIFYIKQIIERGKLKEPFENPDLENVSVFVWDFGDGNTSSEANPTHTYARAGSYTVTLTVYGIPATGTLLGPDDQISQSITIAGPSTIDYLIGSWSPRNLKVGPYSGAGDWWNYNFSGGRPCLEDDVYTFSSDGSLTINHGSETWLENWQTGSGDYCGAPVAPYINGTFSWSFNNDVVTVTGDGAYLVLAKAHNNGEDGVASSRSYNITSISPTTMQVAIDVSGGAGAVWWTYDLVKN